jgi:alpha-galactosidase
MTTADLMVSTGLARAGYEYVNSDDCWVLTCRNPALAAEPPRSKCDDFKGPQRFDPKRFPDGIEAVVKHIHGKGLKMGLYTSASPFTCDGMAASCHYETYDATQWAKWGIDYMKEDACGGCRPEGKIADYKAMQDAIDATGAAMVFTIENDGTTSPGNQHGLVADGAHGNARRIGHDIDAIWLSMVSLVDLGSGLWHFAHNDTGNGGWWNDFDMIEIGRGDFEPINQHQLNMARTHMTYWCICKAVMLL